MSTELASIIVAIIMGTSSIVTAIIWGYVPRKRTQQIKKLQRELLEVYIDVYNLKIVEERLEEENGVSKKAAREGLLITPLIGRKRIEGRISQLQSILQDKHD